jgi:signal transduction histidine kinase
LSARLIVSTGKNDYRLTPNLVAQFVGIAKEYHTRIFERFYQISDPEENISPGLGIGLSISSDIIKRHGGQLWVESQKGEGAIFHVSLPLFQEGKRPAFVEQEQEGRERQDAE